MCIDVQNGAKDQDRTDDLLCFKQALLLTELPWRV